MSLSLAAAAACQPISDRRSPAAPPAPRRDAEGVLKELAFVLHLTHSLKAAMTHPRASVAVGR